MTSLLHYIFLIKRQMAKNNNVNVMNQLFDGHALFVRALLIGLWLEGYEAGFYASEPSWSVSYKESMWSTDGGVEELGRVVW